MKTIYKYELLPFNPTILRLPADSEILSAGVQHDEIFVWVLLDNDLAKDAKRIFYVYGTGHPVNENSALKFIQTVFLRELVFHVFEEINK